LPASPRFTLLLALGLGIGSPLEALAAPLAIRRTLAPQEPAPAPPAFSKRELAWGLGHALSLTALGHAAGAPEKSVTGMFGGVAALADALGTTVAPLPKKTGDSARDSAAVLGYLLRGTGRSIARFLEETYGADHAALFELAIKAQVLNLLYEPGKGASPGLRQGIHDSATRAGLPKDLWQPLYDRISTGASLKDVQREIGTLRTVVRGYLAEAAP